MRVKLKLHPAGMIESPPKKYRGKILQIAFSRRFCCHGTIDDERAKVYSSMVITGTRLIIDYVLLVVKVVHAFQRLILLDNAMLCYWLFLVHNSSHRRVSRQ
jgi:hypothetical protein